MVFGVWVTVLDAKCILHSEPGRYLHRIWWPRLLPSLLPKRPNHPPRAGFRLSQSSLHVRSATTVICGIIVALDSSEP